VRVLQINTTVNSGSTGRIAEEIGNYLIANGHESIIGYGRGAGKSNSAAIRIGTDWDTRFHGLKTLLFDRHGFGSYAATRRFLKEIEKQKPDIIHFHNIHGYYVHVGLLVDFVKKHSIPVVWTLHDSWPYTGHCTFFDNIQCERWKTGCYSCPKKDKYPKSLFHDNSKRNYEDKKALFCSIPHLTIVTPSEWLARLVKCSFLHKATIEVIHNGIDTSVFTPEQPSFSGFKKFPELTNKKIVLGVASIWDPRKGLNDFIELSKMLPDEFRIVLIGLNQKQMNELPDGITGILRTESVQELAGWYAHANVFVNPTWQDNFPTTNIESLACGTPVITYQTGGSPEAISESTGLVVQKGDLKGLLKGIMSLNKTDRKTLNFDCRKRALDCFKKEDRFKDYHHTYKNILSQHAQ
jgi:glycosyltransferase involved in cell wall biosynthesis